MTKPRGPVVLLGEDADVREMIAHLLRARGHTVLEATSPDQVPERCRPDPPAVIIVEAMLPSEEWTRAVGRIQEELGTSCPPIVMLAGSWFLDEPASLTDSVEMVLSPGRGDELLALVERYCAPLAPDRNA